MRPRIVFFALLLFLPLAVREASGHVFELTDTLVILKSDGTYLVDMTCDLDALALGVSPTTDSAELVARLEELEPAELEKEIGDLRRFFERRVRLLFDESPVASVITFPDFGTPISEEAPIPTVLGLTARFEGRIPPGAESFSFRASRSFPPVRLTLFHQGASLRQEIVEKGGRSTDYVLAELAAPGPSSQGVLDTAARYLVLGFWHIVPEGLDHILFVLGLFLLNARWRPLLLQISAFTAAHTVTLALSTYGVFELPASIVEPLIALSITYVALENVLSEKLRPWRPWLVFAFGLLHGLGFAGVLREIGLARESMLTALLAFNIGVELGQLTVILVALAALGAFRAKTWYRWRLAIPISILIAVLGLFWFLERLFQ